jgi:hypothetical protein
MKTTRHKVYRGDRRPCDHKGAASSIQAGLWPADAPDRPDIMARKFDLDGSLPDDYKSEV